MIFTKLDINSRTAKQKRYVSYMVGRLPSLPVCDGAETSESPVTLWYGKKVLQTSGMILVCEGGS